ncbi:hypothetical protein TRICI_003692 [Trichomonascus ciferrii]|uniref:Hyaluronan/mRNA-binding protein domain-containing protein n=1 Tax=Trichomonascus ciferrii TaxID=44093 RepID=A0A642V365_9ASCO|nr:hypothetical protein TRICI_003692 [Trichomonascus ciferrii]
MSVASKRPASVSTVVPEVVKKNTSSKKTDSAPAKADPKRASNKKQSVGGNEAAFRDKGVGRANNRAKGAPEDTARRNPKGSGSRPDRKSQMDRRDTDKQVKKGWGDDKKQLDEEAAAASIARDDELQEDADKTGEQQVDNTMTLEEYFAQLSTKNADLSKTRSVRKPNEGVDDSKWANAEEVHRTEEAFFESQKQKSLRQKQRKEKQTLEPTLTFVSEREQRPARGGARGGARGNARGGARGGNKQSSKPRAGDRSKTTVNINNTEEFPTLGN